MARGAGAARASLCGVDTTLKGVLAGVAVGEFPPADGGCTVLAQPSPRDAGVIAFTAHSMVFADVAPGWVRGLVPAGDLAAPMGPPFLLALASRLGRKVNCVDMLTVAAARPGPPPMTLTPVTDAAHPRVRRARLFRDELRVWSGDGALVMIGRGVAGRWEVAVEVEPACRGRGVGRAAMQAARHLVPGGEPLWAQIAPGNAASVRAFLAAGFVPVGSEVLLPLDGAG
jgi:GNAT superfamily N-acetyltransferase